MMQKKMDREKPRICDPYMCERCEDMGGGDFVCTFDIKEPNGILVVKNWEGTKDQLWCKRKSRNKERDYERQRQYKARNG